MWLMHRKYQMKHVAVSAIAFVFPGYVIAVLSQRKKMRKIVSTKDWLTQQ